MSKEYKQLSELGKIVTGKTPSTTNSEYWDGDIPFITPTDINGYDTFYQTQTERSVSELGASKQKKTILPPNSICITCIGSTIGKPCVTKVSSITNQQINSIVPNKCNDFRYIYYLIRENLAYLQLIGGGSGSGTPIISKNKFAKFKFLVENNLESQCRIASILSAYDNIIENNNKRIRLLEQMVENLYKEWFVRFRFPGHEKVEFENGLPKEWSIIKLGVFIKFERGVGYGSKDIEDGENVLLSMNNIRPYGGFIRDYSRPYSGKYKEFQKVRKGDLIMSITDMTQDRRIIGYTGIVPPGKDNRIICTHLIKLSSEISHTYFLNGLFNYSNLSRIIAERATGANVLGLTADILKGVKTLLPPTELQSMYVTKVTPIIEECFSLQDANDNLARQRDLLLPRLMSGKLEV